MPVTKKPPVVPANAPYLPPEVTQEVAWSLKGLNAGQADASQQALAIRWFVWSLCKTYDLPYRESPRDTDFALGKMYCGQQLVRILNLTPEQIALLPKLRPDGDGEDDEIRNQ